jgi:hypothetical protein
MKVVLPQHLRDIPPGDYKAEGDLHLTEEMDIEITITGIACVQHRWGPWSYATDQAGARMCEVCWEVEHG